MNSFKQSLEELHSYATGKPLFSQGQIKRILEAYKEHLTQKRQQHENDATYEFDALSTIDELLGELQQ